MVFFGLRKEGELEVQVPNAPKTALRFALSNPGSRGFPRYHVIVYQRSLAPLLTRLAHSAGRSPSKYISPAAGLRFVSNGLIGEHGIDFLFLAEVQRPSITFSMRRAPSA